MDADRKLPFFLSLPALQRGDSVSATAHFQAMMAQSVGALHEVYRNAAEEARADAARTAPETMPA